MAKALLNQFASERGLKIRAESAGTEPAECVHPVVADAMREVGLDVSTERPKLLTDELAENSRKVITMGCAVDADACPTLIFKNIEDWALPDPKGKGIDEVREIRDLISRRAEALVATL
jgi:arsenate reductase